MSTMQSLEQRGFDLCTPDGEGVHLGCSQCQAIAINGVACHEHGCPNETHECWECEARIPKRYRLCESCANPDAFDLDEIIEEVDELLGGSA